MTYTAEEVREAAETNEHPIPLRVRDMLRDHANSLERRAEGVTDEVVESVGAALYVYWGDVKTSTRAKYAAKVRAALLAVWPVSAEPATLGDFVRLPDDERQRVGQQVAARVDEMQEEIGTNGKPTGYVVFTAEPAQAVDVRADFHAMNNALCDFAKRWEIDGDYMRCRKCKRPQITNHASHDFQHSTECKAARKVEARPWETFIGLLLPITRAIGNAQESQPNG